MSKPQVLALIPARGGSNSVPRKNPLEVAGRPLIAYSILHAQACSVRDEKLIERARFRQAQAPTTEQLNLDALRPERPAARCRQLHFHQTRCYACREHAPLLFRPCASRWPGARVSALRVAREFPKARFQTWLGPFA